MLQVGLKIPDALDLKESIKLLNWLSVDMPMLMYKASCTFFKFYRTLWPLLTLIKKNCKKLHPRCYLDYISVTRHGIDLNFNEHVQEQKILFKFCLHALVKFISQLHFVVLTWNLIIGFRSVKKDRNQNKLSFNFTSKHFQ